MRPAERTPVEGRAVTLRFTLPRQAVSLVDLERAP
jgi:hypothetical protein